MSSCQSTNTEALRMVKQQTISEGSVVYTFNQKKGRGQATNQWESEANKNLSFSLVLKPDFLAPTKQFELTYVCSLAIVEVLEELSAKEFHIKWPNDILFEGKKIAGILIENSIKGNGLAHSIVGVGLNVNQLKFDYEKAVSLTQIIGDETNLEEIQKRLVKRISTYYTLLKEGIDLKKGYLKKLYQLDNWSSYEDEGGGFTGKIIGVDKIGRLRIEKASGLIQVYHLKEVRFI